MKIRKESQGCLCYTRQAEHRVERMRHGFEMVMGEPWGSPVDTGIRV